MELTDRKKQILKIVVESYINTAEPVGSKAIVEQMPGRDQLRHHPQRAGGSGGDGLSGAAPHLCGT